MFRIPNCLLFCHVLFVKINNNASLDFRDIKQTLDERIYKILLPCSQSTIPWDLLWPVGPSKKLTIKLSSWKIKDHRRQALWFQLSLLYPMMATHTHQEPEMWPSSPELEFKDQKNHLANPHNLEKSWTLLF